MQPIIELMFTILSEESDDETWFLEESNLCPMSAAGECMAAISDQISASAFMPVLVSFQLNRLRTE